MFEKPKSTLASSLEEVLSFDAQDVEMNAFGKLSERQREEFSQKRQRWLIGLIALSLLFGILTLQGLCGLVSQRPDISGNLVLYIGGGGLAIFAAFRKWDVYAQVLEAPLETAEGTVRLDIKTINKSLNYVLKLGDIEFKVEKPVFLAFKNGDPYRIYYALHAKMIVSAEWLGHE